jgi:hypothetical protein
MKCELRSYMVPVGTPPCEAKAVTECTTHNWTFQGPPKLSCPIGRIEEAADEAIKRIRAEHDALKPPA